MRRKSVNLRSKKGSWAVVAAWGGFLCASILQAAPAAHPAGITYDLPAEQKAILARLSSLNEFQLSEWRVHPGDLPHGESPDVSDSSWDLKSTTGQPVKVIKQGEQVGEAPQHRTVVSPGIELPAEATWIRQWVTIPAALHGYAVNGMRLSISFTVRGSREVPVSILYLNGRRVALGADLEPEVLTEDAKAGEKFLIAIKVLAGTEPKFFRSAQFHFDFPEGRPNPQDFRMEATAAATLIPSLSTHPSSDEAVLERAIAMVDVKALDAPGEAGQQRFDSSLKAAAEKLSALRPMLQTLTFHETGNSHIDAAWLWPWSETVEVVRQTFGTAAQLLHEYPKYTYTQSAAQYNKWIADKYPALNNEIKEDIKAGRWEIVGGMWVEPDLNLPDGEALVRSILLGKRWYQKNYGVDVHIGWNPDSFGYNWQLPQIYSKSGIDTFVTQKMTWNDTNQLPLKLFWWESPDGSKVLTYFPQGYANRDLTPVRLSRDMVEARKRAPGLTTMMDLYGVGDHGGGPTRAMLDEGMHWSNESKISPRMEFGTADGFFKEVRPKIQASSATWDYASIAKGYVYPAAPKQDGQIDIPTWNDELYLEYHRGVYTTQAQHKADMRSTEIATIDAEKYASLAWLDGAEYPNAPLTDAWEKIAFNGFHDLAAGSGIAAIYRDSHNDFTQAKLEDTLVAEKVQNTLESRINTQVSSGVPILVWNTLAWKRGGLVETDVQFPSETSGVSVVDSSGKALPLEVLSHDSSTHTYHLLLSISGVPSLGYSVLQALPQDAKAVSDLKADGLTLQNSKLKLTVDAKTGCITSLYNKIDGFETLAAGACGNELQAFRDNPKNYDAWNIDPGTYDVKPQLIDAAESVKLTEQSPVRDTIEVRRRWSNSTFVQRIQLSADADHAVIDNDIDWHESHVVLKAAFPLAATSDAATYEIDYGAIQRPTTRNNSWEKARFEVPALRWADLGDSRHGFSLINDSKYGYDGLGNLLRITLLRSPKSPDPNADMGMQHFRYSLYPHAGTWKEAGTVHAGYEFNYGLTARQVMPHLGPLPSMNSYVSVSSPDVVLTAMKKAEDSAALIFRMYESAGRGGPTTVTVPKGGAAAEIVNMMEQPMNQPAILQGDKVQVTIHPWEILTVAVKYPTRR